ncbi:MAG: hypothetical protein GWN84_06750, partial [Gammaproteobacteria bacterium]|nr:hypothetical protein [Gammaproteobacteria bacterium]NIR88815.1 hypothetical protein [Gammaproteobacteria bacterium]NIU03722.1 hypothetical protein [Gammaproteobacteria bacterium]NIX84996.1 hypothetical protein [Gammaproteobacteria bacterium]
MGGADHDLKSVGISAFERHDWDAAFESLRPLHEQGVLTPAEEMILTEAAMIIGEMQVASRASERAARAFEEAQQPGEAAIACVFCYRL